ncbi:MAG: type II toxin-antitoxin system ParD family antitoxin [Isosphaeraceae bacterium]
MTIHLSEELEQFVNEQVRAGRFPSEDEVVREALEQFRRQTPPVQPGMGSIGAMRDDAEWLDKAVEHAMKVREERPWRLDAGE